MSFTLLIMVAIPTGRTCTQSLIAQVRIQEAKTLFIGDPIGDPIGESIQGKNGFGVREGSEWIDLAIPCRNVVVRGHQLRRRPASGPK